MFNSVYPIPMEDIYEQLREKGFKCVPVSGQGKFVWLLQTRSWEHFKTSRRILGQADKRNDWDCKESISQYRYFRTAGLYSWMWAILGKDVGVHLYMRRQCKSIIISWIIWRSRLSIRYLHRQNKAWNSRKSIQKSWIADWRVAVLLEQI